jgi:hypothetical protein
MTHSLGLSNDFIFKARIRSYSNIRVGVMVDY